MGRVIDAKMYRASSSEKSFCKIITCDNPESCSFYKRGKCICKQVSLMTPYCPHGIIEKKDGYTTRSSKLGGWEDKMQSEYGHVMEKLTSAPRVMGEVGEYVYLPYSFYNNFVNPISWVFVENFCVKSELTIERILELVDFKPRAFTGGVIEDYAKKYVPLLIKDLKNVFPDVYQEVSRIRPSVKEYVSRSDIGRKAYLKTVAVGSKFSIKDRIEEGDYIWDGSKLVCDNYKMLLSIVNDVSSRLEIVPSDNTLITITDDSQVDSNTLFE